MNLRAPHTRGFAALVAAVAAFALVLQYVLLIRATLDTVGPAFATVRFFTYFDLNAHGLATVLRNCAGVFALFLLLGSVLVLVDRWRGRARQLAMATT